MQASWRDLEVYLVRNSRILLPLCFLASVLPAAAHAQSSDLKITTRHTSIGSEFTATTYYSGEKSRSEAQIFSGNVKGQHRAIIRQKGAESVQVYDLDLDAHEYVSYQTNLRGVTPGAKVIALKPSGKTYVIQHRCCEHRPEKRDVRSHRPPPDYQRKAHRRT